MIMPALFSRIDCFATFLSRRIVRRVFYFSIVLSIPLVCASNLLFDDVDLSNGYASEQFSASRYEIEKRFGQFLDEEPSRIGLGDSELFANWDRWFEEYALLLNEAYRRGYEERDNVLEIVDGMARFLISQRKSNFLRIVGESYIADDSLAKQRYDEIAKKQKVPSFEAFRVGFHRAEERRFLLETIQKTEKRVVSEIQLQTDSVVADKLALVIRDHPRLGREIGLGWIQGIEELVVARYVVDGHSVKFDLGEFARRYNLLPMRYSIEEGEAIVKYAQYWAIEDWLWNQAKKKGLLDNPKFTQDRISYQRDTMILEMIRDESDILYPLDREKLLAVFSEKQDRMKRNEEVRGKLYQFGDRMDAFNGYKKLIAGQGAGLDASFEIVVVNANSEKWPKTMRSQLGLVSEGSAMPPVELADGGFGVMEVEEITQARAYAFEDVREDLRAKLAKEHFESVRSSVLEAIRSRIAPLEENLKQSLKVILDQRREGGKGQT